MEDDQYTEALLDWAEMRLDLPSTAGDELFVADLEPPEHLLEESRGKVALA